MVCFRFPKLLLLSTQCFYTYFLKSSELFPWSSFLVTGKPYGRWTNLFQPIFSEHLPQCLTHNWCSTNICENHWFLTLSHLTSKLLWGRENITLANTAGAPISNHTTHLEAILDSSIALMPTSLALPTKHAQAHSFLSFAASPGPRHCYLLSAVQHGLPSSMLVSSHLSSDRNKVIVNQIISLHAQKCSEHSKCTWNKACQPLRDMAITSFICCPPLTFSTFCSLSILQGFWEDPMDYQALSDMRVFTQAVLSDKNILSPASYVVVPSHPSGLMKSLNFYLDIVCSNLFGLIHLHSCSKRY